MRKYIRIIINKRRNLGQFLPLPKKAKGFPCPQYNETTKTNPN